MFVGTDARSKDVQAALRKQASQERSAGRLEEYMRVRYVRYVLRVVVGQKQQKRRSLQKQQSDIVRRSTNH